MTLRFHKQTLSFWLNLTEMSAFPFRDQYVESPAVLKADPDWDHFKIKHLLDGSDHVYMNDQMLFVLLFCFTVCLVVFCLFLCICIHC